jgi:hypothetical protein
MNNLAFVAIKMGRRPGGPSRTAGMSGAYLNRYVAIPRPDESQVIHGTGH